MLKYAYKIESMQCYIVMWGPNIFKHICIKPCLGNLVEVWIKAKLRAVKHQRQTVGQCQPYSHVYSWTGTCESSFFQTRADWIIQLSANVEEVVWAGGLCLAQELFRVFIFL